ncbi:MAG TPA: exo-alpha-sialidase [Candidatus Hydrogenedentes bacterium]|nr:exo-alpha-sialidase [Candidatus Hydrogenedentota bacterium]
MISVTLIAYAYLTAARESPLPESTQPRGFTIPTLDISDEKERQVIVESIPGQYLGHPTTVLLEDNRTILVTYPLGHGGPAAVLKRSTDGGLTWSERLPVPDNWATATNCPCIHRLTGPAGVERLFVFEGNGAMRQSVSLDNGETWTPFEPNGLHCVVAPITIVPISGGRLLMHYHRGYSEQDRSPLTIWQSISEDGGLTWQPERKVAEFPGADPCEPAIIRSPDGKQLASIMRENRRRYNSLLIISEDEGETWSEPVEVPASLTGDRHMPRYAPDGRLVMCFRDTAHESPTRGDFVAWVGTYEDLVNLREGQYRVRLLDSPKKMDLGYSGLELLPDGTFVATTYAVLSEGEKNSVVSVRFTVEDIDKKAALLPNQAVVYARGEGGYHTYRIPALLVTQRGALLAFCEGRRTSSRDHGDIDLLLKRSVDCGETFGAAQVVWQEEGAVTIGNPCPVQDASNGRIWLGFCRDNDRVFVTYSDDDGETWAGPREITQNVKADDWSWYATGPVHGIQISSGRLLMPCDHRYKGSDDKYSHVIYSDDHGATWRRGGELAVHTDECTAVELVDGRVYLNMRSYADKNRRALAYSDDGGETWSDVKLDEALIEPVCQASVQRMPDVKRDGKTRLLFSNPASTERVQMTVRLSYDEGGTWTDGKVLHHGPSAYSDLGVLPDGTILCLYECGLENRYETITLARFSLAWLEEE